MHPTLSALAELYPRVFAEDLARYALGAGGVHLATAVLLRRVLAAHQIRPDRPGWNQMRREIAASLRTVAIFAAFGTGIGLLFQAGLTRIYLNLSDRSGWWLALSLVLLVVLHDAWFYWAHRLMHRPRLYRWFHRLHHRSHNPSAFAAYAFDASEAAVQAAYLPLALALIPAHPLAIFFFTLHMILRNAVGHCGVELFPARADGKPLFGWMTTVTHHDLHHAQARWNLGLYFTWWDRLCGTEHPRYLAEFARAARPGRVRLAAPLLALALLGLAAEGSRAGGLPAPTEPPVSVPGDLDGLRPWIPGIFP